MVEECPTARDGKRCSITEQLTMTVKCISIQHLFRDEKSKKKIVIIKMITEKNKTKKKKQSDFVLVSIPTDDLSVEWEILIG